MTPQEWERVKQIFDLALAEPPADRARFLQSQCGEDSHIRSEVERLLAEHERASGFLEPPSSDGDRFALSGSQSGGTEAPLIGQKISHYEIVAKLGEGGMGIVYRAFDTHLLRPVALKVLSHSALADPESNSRFLREARIASALNHSHIAHVYEIGEAGNVRFIVMEHIEGRTLAAMIREAPLDLTRVLEFALQAADAMAEAHEHGIIHRDLKPSNIMITPRGQLKILDFGLAKVHQQQSEQRDFADPSLSRPGLVIGTTRYMSPEQVLGHDVDQRSDIFSLGLVFYEMVTGYPAFSGGTATEMMDRILHSEPEPIGALRANVPPGLERIIRKCLEKDRAKRYSSVRELYTDLLQLRESRPVKFGSRMDARKLLSRAALKWVAAVVVLVMALVASLYLVNGRGDAIDSLAVLPLDNASGDPDTEYLSDGISESLINSLSQLPRLRVMARSTAFRYKGKQVDPRKAGRDMGVQTVFAGRMTQRGDTLTIGAELVNVGDGSQLWGEEFTQKLSKVLDLQREIASQIVEKLRLKLTGTQQQRLTKQFTGDTEAYQLYLKGRYYPANFYTADGFKKGIGYLNQAIAVDPAYALAYAGLAATYYDASGVYLHPNEAMLKAKAAAMQALKIDETLAEAHTALAQVQAQYEWDWAEADKHYRRALELNPNLAQAHLYYGIYLADRSRSAEGIEEIKRAQQLDPLAPLTGTYLAHYYYAKRQYDQAVSECRKVFQMDSNFFLAHSVLGSVYEQQGNFMEAIAEFNQAKQLDPEQPFTLGYLGHTYAVSGQRDKAQQMIEEIERRTKLTYNVDPFAVAMIFVGLGEKDEAFAWLEKAYQERSENLLYYKDTPLLDSVRSDPRFTNLLRRMNLSP